MSTNKILILGEAWNREEESEGRPFVGGLGFVFDQMLSQVGISRKESYITNVFNLRPQPSNDVINLMGGKADAAPGLPPYKPGKYLRREYLPEITRLRKEIAAESPNVVIAMGATAVWAMLGSSGVKKIRGAATLSPEGIKVIPTYAPGQVARDWTTRPVVLSDLAKAKAESEFPELRRPERFIHIEPTLNDLVEFEFRYIRPATSLSIDIETKGDQLTCIGFAPTTDRCLVVPFYNPLIRHGNYWPTLKEELTAWGWVRRVCAMRKRIVFQNGLYDMHFLWRRYGITVPHAEDDTMLLHHALQPEMEKGLGFLGSLYTNEASWKFMRTRAEDETIKKED